MDHFSSTYAEIQKHHSFLEYDIRKDVLPFEDGSVDVIFCSHVIEHIETKFVASMIKDCQRVLRRGGIMRITCPDAEWMYKMTKLGKREFWIRRKQDIISHGIDFESRNIVDFLIREIAAPRIYQHDLMTESLYDWFENKPMEEFFDFVIEGLEFDENNVGNHINHNDFVF